MPWRRLPFGALFAVALLGCLELGVRAFYKPPFVSLETFTANYPLAPQYGFEGSRACFPVREQMSCRATQDMNIITQDFPRKKPPGELRIIVIGASVSWEGAKPSKSEGNYPSRTLELLQQRHPEKSLRLINLSVPGFGSTRQVVRFREALAYEPDLFIVHTHDTNEVREDQRRAYVRSLHSGIAGKLLYSQAVVVLKKLWSTALDVPAPRPVAPPGEDDGAGLDYGAKTERWLAGSERNVKTMLELAKARSIPVILVGASRGNTNGRDRPLNVLMRPLASGTEVQFLDVPALFRPGIEKHRRYFKDNVHYNAEGTRMVAAELAPLVETALPALH
ncbi:MAG TPA: GDSL-type esterase/lipase family protein [Polyangiaceae bacterium]|nr:GDSL-type esterase/lipase family protein [Polyangiaceae bacterium]